MKICLDLSTYIADKKYHIYSGIRHQTVGILGERGILRFPFCNILFVAQMRFNAFGNLQNGVY
jgi:hypothetical protein